MSNEEKLKKLLEVAVENGFDLDSLPSHFNVWLNSPQSAHLTDRGRTRIELINHTILVLGTITYSIDKLISDWEIDEVSFIDALCSVPFAENKYDNSAHSAHFYPNKKLIIKEWNETPTSLRLDVLFKAFRHLWDIL